MKVVGNLVTGDFARLMNYTAGWHSVKMHPATFYRRRFELETTLSKIKGLWSEIDMGECVLIKFSNKEDVTEFYKKHHSHI